MGAIIFLIILNIFNIAFTFYICKKTESDIEKYMKDKTKEYLSEIKNRHN